MKDFDVSNQPWCSSPLYHLITFAGTQFLHRKNQRYNVLLAGSLEILVLTNTLNVWCLFERTWLYDLTLPLVTIWYYDSFLVYISLKSDIISVCMRNPVTKKNDCMFLWHSKENAQCFYFSKFHSKVVKMKFIWKHFYHKIKQITCQALWHCSFYFPFLCPWSCSDIPEMSEFAERENFLFILSPTKPSTT